MTKTTILSTTILAATSLALPLSAGATAATTTTPHVLAAALVASPQTGKGIVHVLFRTDAPLPRRAPGQGFDAVAHVGARSSSIGSASKRPHCYESYTKAPSLAVGSSVPVKLSFGKHVVSRTLKLKASSADKPATVGC